MTRNDMSNFVAQDSSQFVVVSDYVVEKAGRNEDKAVPKDASVVYVWAKSILDW